MHSKRTRQRGMTLIEIMVVVTIIALLSAAVAVGVIDHLNKAKVDVAKMDLKTFRTALRTYYVKNGHYPSAQDGLEALVRSHDIEAVPADPWGGPYLYMLEDGEPVVSTYGMDQVPGGDGYDADLTSRPESRSASK